MSRQKWESGVDALDDQDARIVRVQLVSAHLADILMSRQDSAPIRLNRHALEFAIETLQEAVKHMDSDPVVDVPAVYDPRTQRPWWI